MVLVVVRDNQIFFRGYGETAPDSHQAPTQDSLLRLCSLTKIFTTDVLTKLVADKTVRLDDPLQHFAPHHVVVPKRIQSITLVDLATHTSGLPRELANAPHGTPHFTFPDYRARWRWLPNERLRSAPGTAALYSNVAFDFLSDALQAATQKQYAALLAERTLNPLRMQNTTFFPSDEQCSRLLISSNDEGPCTVTESTAGSSGLYSTASDMAIWLQYLLGTGGPGALSQDSAAQAVYILPSHLVSQQGLGHAGEPTGIGLGWIHILPVDSPSHIIEKTGGGAGFEDLHRHQPLPAHRHLYCRYRRFSRHSPEPLQCRKQTSACCCRSPAAAAPSAQTGTQTLTATSPRKNQPMSILQSEASPEMASVRTSV